MWIMAGRERDRDRELLIPVGDGALDIDGDDVALVSAVAAAAVPIIAPPASSVRHLHHTTGIEAFSKVIRSWASKKFMTGWECYSYVFALSVDSHRGSAAITSLRYRLARIMGSVTVTSLLAAEIMPPHLQPFLPKTLSFSNVFFLAALCVLISFARLGICVILFPIAMTFYITWWFFRFVDGFFSPIYTHLGINVFGLGFITSITFIFLVGVFMSSWLGASVLGIGEWLIKKMPLVRHIYSASKQISAAISPDQSSRAFKEVIILRHPRIGEYAIGFITSTVVLRSSAGDEELSCVYVPTNHLYLGDIFLMSKNDVIRPNLSVREAIEIVLSGGMSIPQIISTVEGITVLGDNVRIGKSP